MPIMPAISRMVVLPNHIRQFMNPTSPLTDPMCAMKSYGSLKTPIAIRMGLTGPPLENSVKNSMEKAAAMIRFGR